MEPKLFLNYPVSQVLGTRDRKGNLLGVELELEGRGVGLEDIATAGWARHREGSLRGESIEFALNVPKTHEDTKKKVTELFSKFAQNGVKLNNSHRTSTHVHMNFSDKPMKKAINFFALFTVFEEVLQYYSGDDRKGNLFCISTREAEGIVRILVDAISAGTFHMFAGDRYKYAACNLSSLYKFGSIEVRTMRGANSAEQVNNWIDILNEMYEYSLKMVSPVDLLNDLSMLGAEALMGRIFSVKSKRELLSTFPAIRTLHQSLMDGARIIQLLAYEFDGAMREDVKIPEPKVAAKGKDLPIAVPGPLPSVFLDNAGRRTNIIVYRPDTGGLWTCFVPNGEPLWRDGMACHDDRNLIYNQPTGRFVLRYPDGTQRSCRFRAHPQLGNEGPPARAALVPLPRPRVEEDDEEIDDDGWDGEPDVDIDDDF